MKEYIPDPQLQKYIHRFWIVSSPEAMPAEKCVLDGFVKLFLYLNDNNPERVQEAPTDEARVGVFNAFFTSLAQQLPPAYTRTVEAAQDQLLQHNGILSIERLSGQLNVSRRSLERPFYSKPHPIESVYVGRAEKSLR